MKRLIAFLTALIFSVFVSVTAFAQDINLLSDYKNIMWEGTGLIYNEEHRTLSLKEKGSAFVTFDTGDNTAIWVYTDMGNYKDKGTGNISLEFLDGEGNVILKTVSDNDPSNGYFIRSSYGSDALYASIPENTERVRFSLSFTEGEKSPYFRNLSLVLSNTAPRSDNETEWKRSGDLTIVQVNVTGADYIMFIVLVCLVGLVMIAVRLIRDKIRNKK